MEQITIQVRNKKKAQALLDFLKTLDYIENVKTNHLSFFQAKDKGNEEDFFDLAGLWAKRDVTLEAIREKAWPSRS